MFTDNDIKSLEKMAKLDLPDAERSEIKKYMDFLLSGNEAGACSFALAGGEGIKPMIYATERLNVFREDKAVKNIERETLLSGAPDHDDMYFKVPKTVE